MTFEERWHEKGAMFATMDGDEEDAAKCAWDDSREHLLHGIRSNDKITQVSGFQWVDKNNSGYLLVAATESGDVVMSTGNGEWASVGQKGKDG